jgi:predicted amidohydrolase
MSEDDYLLEDDSGLHDQSDSGYDVTTGEDELASTSTPGPGGPNGHDDETNAEEAEPAWRPDEADWTAMDAEVEAALMETDDDTGASDVSEYAELTPDGTPYNTCAYVSAATGAVAKYRKVHLPGTVEPFSEDPDKTNQLEKRYFKPGNLRFKAFRASSLDASDDPTTKAGPSPIVGMLICNDRRWAEAWRVYGLQGTEIMCCGYNTTAFAPELWGSDQNITREQGRADAMVGYISTARVSISN